MVASCLHRDLPVAHVACLGTSYDDTVAEEESRLNVIRETLETAWPNVSASSINLVFAAIPRIFLECSAADVDREINMFTDILNLEFPKVRKSE